MKLKVEIEFMANGETTSEGCRVLPPAESCNQQRMLGLTAER